MSATDDDALAADVPVDDGSRSGPRHIVTLAVDERGVIVRADCPDRHMRRLWQVRTGEPLRAYLGRWDPSSASAVEAAWVERRHLRGRFFARVGARLWLCSLDYSPVAAGPSGVVRLDLCAESGRAPDQVFETALHRQQQAGMGQTILSELNQDRDLRQGLSLMLPHLLAALDMDAGAVFVCRSPRAARLMAIHGSTHQRGYPYEDLDLTDPDMVHLAQQPQLTIFDPRDAMQRGLKAVMGRGFRLGVLAPCMAGHAVAAYVGVSTSRGRELSLDAARTLATACEAIGPLAHGETLVQKIQRDEAILHSSQAVVHTISQSLDLNETYQEIAMSAVSTVSGSSCLLLDVGMDHIGKILDGDPVLAAVFVEDAHGRGFVPADGHGIGFGNALRFEQRLFASFLPGLAGDGLIG